MQSAMRSANLRHLLMVPLLILAAVLSAGVVFARPADQARHSTPPNPQRVQGCTPGWEVVASPNGSPYRNRLKSIEIVSTTDAWAVGSKQQGEAQLPTTLIEHWDGSQWSVVPSPNPVGGVELYGVSAAAGNDVWAVGGNTSTNTTIILHWNGSSWSIVPSPNVDSFSILYGVTSISATDAWAVGRHTGGALTLHWDGAVWSVISNPSPSGTELMAVSSLSSSDVWAVGDHGSGTITIHWDGTQWSLVPSPNTGIRNLLYGVEAITSDDVWAVGEYNMNGFHSLTLHWDGTAWASVPNTGTARLKSVTSTSASNVWAVGGYYLGGLSYSTATMHWDGTQWTEVASPNPDPYNNELFGIDALSPNELWAAGRQGAVVETGTHETLVLKYTGACVTPTLPSTNTATTTPTSTPTNSPTRSATSTPQPPSFTTTSTATSVIPTLTTPPTSMPPTLTPSIEPTAQSTCEGIWRTYDMSPWGAANAVDGSIGGDVWEVGFAAGPLFLPDAQRWNGAAWERTVTLEWTNNGGIFDDVSVIGPDDVWAAGASLTRLFDSWPEVAHWDGTSWTRQSFPSPELESRFSAIDAVDESDIWAVGSYFVAGRYRPLIYHYDGLIWRQVASPELPERAGLWGVTAVAQDDVWAVGYTGDFGVETTLIEHWNGTTWSVVAAPSLGSLSDVEAISANNVWAVGDGGILHWDGISWNVVSAPSGARAVSAISSDDIWAISAASVLHWDGAEWRVVTTLLADLTDVAAVAPGDVWVVGNVNGSGNISFHYTNQQFTDVPPTNTFYSQVQCLACRGIISGYADGTFRPNNQVTRGQLAKIVSNSAGFSEIPTQQTFEDVPPSNTFYEWIERLTTRGCMTGYVCGGPGEPCTTGRPYFRPFANATRGQTAKIVSNAAGFSEPPVGQTFQDVPPTHTFHEFIQRLAARNVMQGYACGGPGEPCVNNRPYFRPQNDVTRGQSAKIVANTFFPDCNPEAHQ